MENMDILVLRTLCKWRTAHKRALLATVVRTWGSSPRPIGSIMALCEDGSVVGSVSGGCIEDDLIYQYTRSATPMPSGAPRMVKYGISADEAHRFGLPCGGTLELLLEFDPEPEALQNLLHSLDRGELVQRTVELADGHVSLQPCDTPSDLLLDSQYLHNVFGPGYRMLIIGAGALSEYLATMAQFNDFSVTVCDPREEYRATWSVPGVQLTSDMPDDVVTGFHTDRRCAVVALTHDPKLDDLALLEALHSEAFYIGAIGSRRNHQARNQRLMEHFDASADDLARLRGPIGLFIGSKTPPEIAVSVMAEVLAVKNGVALSAEQRVGPAKDRLALARSAVDTLSCNVA
jgi:xanthine dehydrogenase accessory factor